jgi:iron-sulfur cluster repair protein YtfE (RIC family)
VILQPQNRPPEVWRANPIGLTPIMNIHDYFRSEHRQIEEQVSSIRKTLKASPEKLEVQFSKFHSLVRSHLRGEDEIYYPSVDGEKQISNRTLMHDLRNDHAAVVFTLESLAIRLRRKVPLTEWQVKFESMAQVLLAHFAHEENVLFPEVEKRITAADLNALLTQVKDLL